MKRRDVHSLVVALIIILMCRCKTLIPELDPATVSNPRHLDATYFRQHVLMFDSRGQLRDPIADENAPHVVSATTAYPLLDASNISYTSATIKSNRPRRSYFDDIIAGIEEHRKKHGRVKLLLFFHGGLNSRGAALARAAKNLADMQASDEDKDIYPIFVNWETGLYASYRDHLLFVHNGQDTYAKGAALWPFELAGDLVRAVTDLPVANAMQWNDTRRWTHHYDIEGAVQDTACELDALSFTQGAEQPPATTMQRAGQRAGALAMYLLTKWWTVGIISSAGRSAWSSMVYTSDRLFYSDQEMHHPYQYTSPAVTGSGGLSRFLERLTAEMTHPGDELILVGHSAGTIVINDIIGMFGERLPIKTLVYMAPACTIDELMPGGRVATFLGKPDSDRHLFILALHEQSELNERFHFDLTPRGSLLVWLDDFIQPKHSEFRGMMMGRVRNLKLHAHLIPCAVQKKIQITAFNEDPSAKPGEQPQRHGDFGELPYWRADTWTGAKAKGLQPVRMVYNPPEVVQPQHDPSSPAVSVSEH